MDFIDFMWIKLIVLCVIVGVFSYIRGYRRGRYGDKRRDE